MNKFYVWVLSLAGSNDDLSKQMFLIVPCTKQGNSFFPSPSYGFNRDEVTRGGFHKELFAFVSLLEPSVGVPC